MEIVILLSRLAAPARRAIQSTGMTTLEQLAQIREAEVRALHGIGQNALTIITASLVEHGLSFSKDHEAV